MSSPAKDFPIAPLPRRGSLVDGILAVLTIPGTVEDLGHRLLH